MPTRKSRPDASAFWPRSRRSRRGPWATMVRAVEPFYPNGTGRGRPPIGLERMLRMYVAQQCFGLSDEGMEDAIYDSQSIRRCEQFPCILERCASFTTAALNNE